MISPGAIKYKPQENWIELLFFMQMLVSDQKHDSTRDITDAVQRVHRPEAIHPHTKVILFEPMGWCAVIEDYLHPLEVTS